jgi:hypothetical protein
MQLNQIILAMALLWPIAAGAQAPSSPGQSPPDPDHTTADLNQQWMALNISLGNVQKSLAAFVSKANEDAAKASRETETESHLKWLLDNPEWLGAPKAGGK